VRLVYQEAGIAVTVAGTASGSAALGQRVAVRVDGGGRTRRLEGIVAGPGLVRLP
jgi:flagella basal body P-ring formation protein FlgA